MVKVFINPGHGGTDPGATYKGLKERDVVKKISVEVQSYLTSNGIESKVFQEGSILNGKTTTLNDVPKQANSYKADIFVSIHMNAVAPNKAKGVEVLYHKNSTKGKQLANTILTDIVNEHPLYNRGLKADVRNLLVLRATNMPACLVECGFIDNDNDQQYVNSHIKELGTSIAKGVIDYLKSEKLITVESTKTSKPNPKTIKIESGSEENKFNLTIDNKVILVNNSYDTVIKYLANYA